MKVRDGSYSTKFDKSKGFLVRAFAAIDQARIWKVLANDLKLPVVDYDDYLEPNNFNDTLIVAVDDPREVVFVKAAFTVSAEEYCSCCGKKR